MQDTRPRAALNGKRVNLPQLADEIGAALCASETEVVVADPEAKVTKAALARAIAAHTPPPQVAPEPPFTHDERRRLRALINGS